MTAVIYNFNPPVENDTTDAAERLFSALGRYSSAELLELLYVGEEPGFFELMRGLFAMSDESRLVLQNFLTASASQRTTATIDRLGRCVLSHDLRQDIVQDIVQDISRDTRLRQQDPA